MQRDPVMSDMNSSTILSTVFVALIAALIACAFFLRDYPILVFVVAAAVVVTPIGWKRRQGMPVDIPTAVFNIMFLLMFLSEVLGITDIHERLPWWGKWAWVSVLAVGNLILRWRTDWATFQRDSELRRALQDIVDYDPLVESGDNWRQIATYAKSRARDALSDAR